MVCMVFTSTCLLISSECRFHSLTSSPQILRTDELTAVALVYCVCVRQRERVCVHVCYYTCECVQVCASPCVYARPLKHSEQCNRIPPNIPSQKQRKSHVCTLTSNLPTTKPQTFTQQLWGTYIPDNYHIIMSMWQPMVGGTYNVHGEVQGRVQNN